jgi:EARP and GARP complex-interacting protein 1
MNLSFCPSLFSTYNSFLACFLQFFDLRSAKRPILVGRGGHSHWVWNVQYNPFHDQLVLSTGTDSIVNLWRVSTISSAPLLTLDDDFGDNDDPYGGGGGGPDEMGGSGANRGGGRYGGGATTSFSSSGPYDPDGPTSLESSSAPNLRVTRYDHGGDPVYASAWGSAADAWIYATVSYDGTVALNHVPSKEKYKILL